MDPVTQYVITTLLGGLGGLFGRGGQGAGQLLNQAGKTANPQNLTQWTEMLYKAMLGSPMFANAQRGLMSASSNAQSSIAGSLASRGLTGTGIGALSTGAGASLYGSQLSDLFAKLYGQAGTSAMDLIRAKLQGASGLPQPTNFGANIYGTAIAGLGDLLKNLPKPTTAGPNVYQGGSISGSGIYGGLPSNPVLPVQAPDFAPGRRLDRFS